MAILYKDPLALNSPEIPGSGITGEILGVTMDDRSDDGILV